MKETVLHKTFGNVLGLDAFPLQPFLFSSSVAAIFLLLPLLLHFIPLVFTALLGLATRAKKGQKKGKL